MENPISANQFARLLGDEVGCLVARLGQETGNDHQIGEPAEVRESVIVSGAFNPIHEAHRTIAELARQRSGMPAWFELCIDNVDKPELDLATVNGRARQEFGNHGLLITKSPTFTEKSRLFPNCQFAVGADTILRVNDPRYYQNDLETRSRAFQIIAKQGCRFLVFPRNIANITAAESNSLIGNTIDSELVELCEFVSDRVFSMNISSTKIRSESDGARSDGE